MKRILFGFMILLLLPAASKEASHPGALELAFHIKATAPATDGKLHTEEIAPKVAVMSGTDAEIQVGEQGEPGLKLHIHPILQSSDTIDLTLQVNGVVGSAPIRQKTRLVSLLGHRALVEIEDEQRGVKLSIEVTSQKNTR